MTGRRSASAFRAEISRALAAASPDAHPASLPPGGAGRFRIYRNNVHYALEQALAGAYPVVRRLVGAAFFGALARAFSAGETTREASFALYGAGFPEFVEGFEPAARVVYLADVARLERARLCALHARDAPALTPQALGEQGDGLAEVSLLPHPSARLVCSGHPVLSIWRAHQDAVPRRDLRWTREQVIVLRRDDAVCAEPLADDEAMFAQQLFAGNTLRDAHAAVAARHPRFDLEQAFARLLVLGAFCNTVFGR